MARFEAEAWAAAKINHPNIIHIYAIGTVDGIRFIAMEYVQGTNLKDYITKKGIPDLALSLAIMRQSALAVGAAGEVGLIHRDIKPENLMLTKKGQIKVADFGLCRLPEGERLHLTQTGMTLGTPVYMSPEQVQGHAIDHRSDLYSLGVTFYHMLAGQPPFRAETALALALKHVREQPPSLAVARPDLPADLVALVMKLMAKSPKDRYASAGDMLRDLARVKEQLHAHATGAVTLAESSAYAAPSISTKAIESDEEIDTDESTRGFPMIQILSAIGLTFLILGGVAGWLGRTKDLLAASAPAPETMPALWMAPWDAIPRQNTAIEQYRYALTASAPTERQAAWLAVPGYFPNSHDESYLAYLQLARDFLRQDDKENLRRLSAEIKEAEQNNGLHRARWDFLATTIHAAELAVLGEGNDVAFSFRNVPNVDNLDPAIAELALEAVTKALRKVEARGGDSGALTTLRDQLRQTLKMQSRGLDAPARIPRHPNSVRRSLR